MHVQIEHKFSNNPVQEELITRSTTHEREQLQMDGNSAVRTVNWLNIDPSMANYRRRAQKVISLKDHLGGISMYFLHILNIIQWNISRIKQEQLKENELLYSQSKQVSRWPFLQEDVGANAALLLKLF